MLKFLYVIISKLSLYVFKIRLFFIEMNYVIVYVSLVYEHSIFLLKLKYLIQSRFKPRLFDLHVFFAFLKNLRQKFRIRKFFSTQGFARFTVFSFCPENV